MRICFVLEYYYPHIGGAEVLFQNLAEGLVREGHECDVLTCRLPGTPKKEVLNGVNIHRITVPGFADRYWFTVLSLFIVFKYARKSDIVHTMAYNGAFPGWFGARVMRKPSVITIHEIIGKRWHKIGINPVTAFVYRMLENMVLLLPFDAYSCISRSTLDAHKVRGKKPEKLFLAYPGIDRQLFKPGHKEQERAMIRKGLGIRDNVFLCSFYGRPGYVKGVEYLIRAFPYANEKVPDLCFLLILSRKPEKLYRRALDLIKTLKLKIGKDIIVIDPVKREELPLYIQSSDCVVVPSLNEGFGFTCVEACTMGKPVVATNAGSLPEVVFGKYILVRPGDEIALADGIEKVYKGEYTISEDQVFSWDRYVEKHIEMYDQLAKHKSKNIRSLKKM
jgi:glycosyltransferase involved in cell wall biosynthesis